MEENPDTAVAQMDSVIGSVSGKCLLTAMVLLNITLHQEEIGLAFCLQWYIMVGVSGF